MLRYAVVALFLGAFAILAGAQTPDITTGPNPDFNHPHPETSLHFPIDRVAIRRLEAVQDYIREQHWAESVEILHSLIVSPKVSSVPMPRAKPAAGHVALQSVRSRVTDVLRTLPLAGREFYELEFGPKAQELLRRAKDNQDVTLLHDLVRRYPLTRAGAEGLAILGAYYLDRAQIDVAGYYYKQLFADSLQKNFSPATLTKAIVCFRTTGKASLEAQAWERVRAQADEQGILLGEQRVSVEQLARDLDAVTKRLRDRSQAVVTWKKPSDENGEVPLLTPTFRLSMTEHPLAMAWLQRAMQKHEVIGPSQVRVRHPSSRPLFLAGKMVYRGYGGIVARDSRSGKVLWTHEMPLSLEGQLQDSNRKPQLRRWFWMYVGRQTLLFENDNLGSLSSDGRYIYAVEDLALPPHPFHMYEVATGACKHLFSTLKHAIHHNRLRAIAANSGKLVWEIGGREDAHSPLLAGAYFLGPPLPVGNQLWAVVQQRTDVRLLCLDSYNGNILWAVSLGTAPAEMKMDFLRRISIAPLAYADGVLVCSTCAGLVVGVDPMAHALLWAHSYEAKRVPGDRNVQFDGVAKFAQAWPRTVPSLTIWKDRVVFLSPESESLRCLKLRTGELLWKEPADPVCIGIDGFYNDAVVLLQQQLCRVHRLEDGRQIDSCDLDSVVGRGVIAGNNYFVPTESNLTVIDLDDRKVLDLGERKSVRKIPFRHGESLGNLVFHEGHLWSMSPTTLLAYPRSTSASPASVSK